MPINIQNHITRLKDHRESFKSRQELEQQIRFIHRKLVKLSFSQERQPDQYETLISSLNKLKRNLAS